MHAARTPLWLLLAGALFVQGLPAHAADARSLVNAKCAKCHGLDGVNLQPETPRLTGLSPAYLQKQMQAFAEGRRRNEDMAALANELGEDGWQAAAAWYATQKPGAGSGAGNDKTPANAKLAETGRRIYEEGNGNPAVQPCVACHQPEALGNARFPRLAGQSRAYLVKQLNDFKAGRRSTDPQMTTEAQALNAQDIKALAEYLGSL